MAVRFGMEDEVLAGGVANAGAVRRRGEVVIRPASPASATIHPFLGALRRSGFDGAPEPISLSDDEEQWRFVEGSVALPPYPNWVRTDTALASIARLLRRFHDASASVSDAFLDGTWSDAFAQPSAGTVICHFDVCIENVVFRHGEAVALLDFDLAGPGDPLDDVASFARMCVPVDDEVRRAALGWSGVDVGRRLAVVVDAYAMAETDRAGFIDRIDASIERAEQFVWIRVERGEPNFVAMWNAFGGAERFRRRRAWFDDNRHALHDAITS